MYSIYIIMYSFSSLYVYIILINIFIIFKIFFDIKLMRIDRFVFLIGIGMILFFVFDFKGFLYI